MALNLFYGISTYLTYQSFLINETEEFPYTDNTFDPTLDPLYMHEYGHYLQSQSSGFGYLFQYGIPSLMSASISRKMNSPPFTTHRITSVEKDANERAAKYFKKYGVNWKEDCISSDYRHSGYLYSEIYPLR